jgi:hypothetical protein
MRAKAKPKPKIRIPVPKPTRFHSTPKGKRGYNPKRLKRENALKYQNIKFQVENGIGYITLNCPEKRGAPSFRKKSK